MSPNPSPSPLKQEHCQCLDRVLASIPPMMELAKACNDCGWDTTELQSQLQQQLDMATKAKAKFFPNNP